ncbi:MAG: phospho-sugar mutase [Spirochaetales bacterium]|nr:phospho-sugar mutase [Spirochaetales bacterium]
MDKPELIAKAEQYLKLEKHPFFLDEMRGVIAKQDYDAINDRFYKELDFGTGGLRGVIGGGFNRMNPYIVKRTTQGLANYVLSAGIAGPSAVIAYDSRNFSDLFAREAALVFAANGIKTSLFSGLRPTPELSFAVRQLGATTGIVITASHNPAEYNGYKVYWSDGGQIVAPHDKGIIGKVREVGNEIKTMDWDEALKKGLVRLIDREIDDPFIAMVRSYSLRPELLRAKGKDIRIVYTPLHGSGTMLVERVLREAGIGVLTVPEQREPDGNFPTVNFPNPEEASALKMALALAAEKKADLLMGTDPDADRLGIAVPEGDRWVLVTGNQLGALLADYIFSSLRELGRLPARPAFVKTIVTTDLQRRIAESYGASSYDVLTGFKYIAEKIREFESTGEQYIFGGEESYGYLVETETRDKDAVSAAFLTAEMALYHVSRGSSVLAALKDLYTRYGYFEEFLVSQYFKGESGQQVMEKLMESLRTNTPGTIGGIPVSEARDFLKGRAVTLKTGTERKIMLPASNVLQWQLEDGSIVTARPSGTEPKIKFYCSCVEKADGGLDKAKKTVDAKIDAIKADVNAWLKP